MTERTDITISLDAVMGEVAKFDRIGAGLAALEAEHPKNVVLDVATTAGMAQAIESRRAWRDPRIALEKARQAAKRPVLDLGRKIDAFAGDLEVKLREGEDHYDAQIKAEEGRKEVIRQERLQAEAERIAGIRRRIAQTFAAPVPPGVRPTVDELVAMRGRLENEPVDDTYGDLKIEAQETKVVMLQALDEKIAEQRAYEAQQAELARERAALAEERKARAEENARQQAQIDAQRAELDRREAESREADRKRLEAAWQAEQQATRERVAREAAEVVRAESRREALNAAAPLMRDCLTHWRAAELHEDAAMLDYARVERDRILSDLRLSDAQTTTEGQTA